MSFSLPPQGPQVVAAHLREELWSVGRTLQRVRYLRLRQELTEAVNPEINTDRQTLVSRLEALGFRREIVEALQELDRRLYEAARALDFKGVIDLARTIFEKIIEDAAKKAAQLLKQSPPSAGKPFQPWKQFLIDADLITSDEGELLQKLYNYLSNAGAHKLGSAPEQARVTKNMVVELGLLVVGRVQTLK